MQRISDLIIFFILIIPVFVFVIFLSILIVVTNKISPLFVFPRIGKNGKLFNCYKLQCMTPTNSFSNLANSKSDKLRMTKFGKIYRDHGWDELPQLINILRGEMSFVGPRPIMEIVYKQMKDKFPLKIKEIDLWKISRLNFLPGLSGWHQVHLNDHNIIKYDNEYISNPTIQKKLEIFYKSILIFLFGKKVYFKSKVSTEMYEYEI